MIKVRDYPKGGKNLYSYVFSGGRHFTQICSSNNPAGRDKSNFVNVLDAKLLCVYFYSRI